MKVLGNLPPIVVKDENAIYPFGAAIKNETETEQGTQVIREIYNDILMNLYKLLQLTGITPTDEEDNNTNGYQIIEAIKKLPNSLNDIEQVLTLSGTVWSIPFDLAYLPNKYFFVARASEDYVNTETYTFKGSGVLELPFTAVGGFSATDELLVIIDTSGVRAYSLVKLVETPNTIYTTLGTPISFSDISELYYFDNGYLMKDYPASYSIQNSLRLDFGFPNLQVNDVFIHNGIVVCFCFNPDNNSYYCYDININNFTNLLNRVFDNTGGLNYNPFSYMDLEGNLWITNKGNLDGGSNDYEVSKFIRDEFGIFQLSFTVTLDVLFEKTTNAVVKDNYLYCFINDELTRYDLSTGVRDEIMFLPGINGQLFRLGGDVYFSTGEVAKKWNI